MYYIVFSCKKTENLNCYIPSFNPAQNMRQVTPQKLPCLGRAFTDVQEMKQVSSKKLMGWSEEIICDMVFLCSYVLCHSLTCIFLPVMNLTSPGCSRLWFHSLYHVPLPASECEMHFHDGHVWLRWVPCSLQCRGEVCFRENISQRYVEWKTAESLQPHEQKLSN